MTEEEPKVESSPTEKKRNPLVAAAVALVGVVSAVWIFIPEPTDFVPVAGLIDEAVAIAVVIACCSYFGFDVKGILSKFGKNAPDEKPAKGKVIESDDA